MEFPRPIKLRPLQLYSPFSEFKSGRRLISREKESFTTPKKKSPITIKEKIRNCVRSFAWMYDHPSTLYTSYHAQQKLGRKRLPRQLPSLSLTEEGFFKPKNSQLSKTMDMGPQNSLDLSFEEKKVQEISPTRILTKKTSFEETSSVKLAKYGAQRLKLTSATIDIMGQDPIEVPLDYLKFVVWSKEDEIVKMANRFVNDDIGYGNGEEYEAYNSKEIEYMNYSSKETLVLVKTPSLESEEFKSVVEKVKNVTRSAIKSISREDVYALSLPEDLENETVAVLGVEGEVNENEFAYVSPSVEEGLIGLKRLLEYRKAPVSIKFDLEKPDGPSTKAIFHFPTVELFSPIVSYKRPIPLNILKNLIEEDYLEWNHIILKYLEDYEGISLTAISRRSGMNTISLKSKSKFKDTTVLLTLNSAHLQISNSEINTKMFFKVKELKDLSSLFYEHPDNFLISLQDFLSLEEKEGPRKNWVLSIVIPEQTSSLIGNLTEVSSEISINGQVYTGTFKMPIVEMHNPIDHSNTKKEINSDILKKLIESNFENWEEQVIDLFE